MEGEPLDNETLSALSALCWPEAPRKQLRQLQSVWFNQPFLWSCEPKLHCFFEQHENGPCGVLSSVQALLIQRLLFPFSAESRIEPFEIKSEQRHHAFAETVAYCLWRAGGYKEAVYIYPSTCDKNDASPIIDEIPSEKFVREHKFVLKRATNEEHAQVIAKDYVYMLYEHHGVVLFLYSLILSRGIDATRKDLAISSDVHSFIFSDSCCEQAIVNFILGGRACNEVDYDHWRNDLFPVGFLTVEEAYHPATCFVSPACPVWVVHGGGHYTVLWSDTESVLEHGVFNTDITSHDDIDLVQMERLTHTAPADVADAEIAKAIALSLEPSTVVESVLETSTVVESHDAVQDCKVPVCGATRNNETAGSDETTGGDEAHEQIPEPEKGSRTAEQDTELARAIAMSLEQDLGGRLPPPSKRRKTAEIPTAKKSLFRENTSAWSENNGNRSEDNQLSKSFKSLDSRSSDPCQNLCDLSAAASVLSSINRDCSKQRGKHEVAQGYAEPINSSYEEEQIKRAMAASLLPSSPLENGFDTSSLFKFWHYNGLHPPNANGRPVRIASILSNLNGMSNPSTSINQDDESENLALQAKAILTHRVVDGGTANEGPYEYLIVCSPDGCYEGKPSLRSAGKWRCRDCHLLNPPNWKAFMEQHETVCKECKKDISVCGFCHWIPKNKVTTHLLRSFERHHAPPIVKLLRRRWPGATLAESSDCEPLPSLWG